MGKGLSRVQRQILGLAHVTLEVLRSRGETLDRGHYVHRLGLWAIYGHPASGRRGAPTTLPARAARAALSRTAIRLGRRGLLARHHRFAWVLTPRGEALGAREAAAFRGWVDLQALCGLEFIRDASGIARREWGASPAELRAALSGRVRAGSIRTRRGPSFPGRPPG